jgi:transposase InsO family protein
MKTRLPGSGRTRENLLQKSVFRGNNSTRARKSIDRNLGKKLIRIWRVTIKEWFRFYNEERPHQSLNDKTPNKMYYAEIKAA